MISDLEQPLDALTSLSKYGIVPCAYRVPTRFYPVESKDKRYVTIEWRDVDRWAIVDGGLVLARDGEWEVERQPSSRTNGFKERTRYPLAEAMQRAINHFDLKIIG